MCTTYFIWEMPFGCDLHVYFNKVKQGGEGTTLSMLDFDALLWINMLLGFENFLTMSFHFSKKNS